ncbi:BTAD domain-containing putative transcriptional regulator [Deinococcus sonorensis]|uniref:BTAD domain-containing putative transcriptional regulator n=2 Tax=Deinococcus sonorensis TaxID=309891 RepID=A0AAU7U5K6_9DEIO
MSQARRAWRLALLGPPRVIAPDGSAVPLERKTAGLLAYLALEGAAPRAVLADLLWPDATGSAARNNLVHVLRRLRQLLGEPPVQGGDLLTLTPELAVDARTLAEAPTAEPAPGGLLDAVDFDDCPGFMEWLLAWRERLDVLRARAYATAIERCEQALDWAQALTLTRQWLELDRLSEDAFCTLMRLHYRNGDRASALRAYHRCQQVLRRELGADPSPQTRRLAQDIDRGTLPGAPAAAPGRLPLRVLRPPTLVGREDAWAALEDAWAARKLIYVTGEAGEGKTRLVRDFVASKGPALYLPGHPGGREVPYAGTVHNARARLAAATDVVLPDWVRCELSRIIPELRGSVALPPLIAEEDRLKFFAAYREMVRLTSAGFNTVVNDDTHQYDQATVELGAFMLSQARLGDANDVPRHISVYRRGALSAPALATVDHLVQSGAAVRVELGPLSEDALGVLLRDLQLPGATVEIAQWLRLTGGNPQFVLEAAKHVLEQRPFEAGAVLRSLPDHLFSVIERRLAGLSPAALQVARAAAVLRGDFSPELVSDVLGATLMDTAVAWEELEAAQVMMGERFSHDLVQEAVLQGTPPAVRRVLHRANARTLARHPVHPARVAQHWLDSGEPAQAAVWLMRAGAEAYGTSRLQEARQYYQAAQQAYQAADDPEQAHAAQQALDTLSRDPGAA